MLKNKQKLEYSKNILRLRLSSNTLAGITDLVLLANLSVLIIAVDFSHPLSKTSPAMYVLKYETPYTNTSRHEEFS